MKDSKNTKKDSKKKHIKNIKIFLKKKKKKGIKKTWARYQNLSEEQMHKLLEYMRNQFLAYNK